MTAEATLTQTDGGLIPKADGWFVVNARDAAWGRTDDLGRYCAFEGEAHFPQYGINIHVLDPGQPNCMYHEENNQEDFLVLAGECILIVEGQEQKLRAWDFVHCPPGTAHVLVGAGNGPCAILMTGARREDESIRYPVDSAAARHGACVETETTSPREAYARFARPVPSPYRDGDLPA